MRLQSQAKSRLTFISVQVVIGYVLFGAYTVPRIDASILGSLSRRLVVVCSKYRSAVLRAVAHPGRPVRTPAQHRRGEANSARRASGFM